MAGGLDRSIVNVHPRSVALVGSRVTREELQFIINLAIEIPRAWFRGRLRY
jgi:hypothetical protein